MRTLPSHTLPHFHYITSLNYFTRGGCWVVYFFIIKKKYFFLRINKERINLREMSGMESSADANFPLVDGYPTTSSNVNANVNANAPLNDDDPPTPPPPDCPATFVSVPIMIVPEIDLTICKPKIRVTNKGICNPNCECEGCV